MNIIVAYCKKNNGIGFDNKIPWILKNDLQNATIIGHSLGGTIATWLASQNDIKLSKIILIDALPASGALMIPNFNPEKLMYESPYNNQLLAMDDVAFEQTATTMSKLLITASKLKL
jgi:pimeloyl-ACP methyl ester carboxylesterase